MAQHDYDIANQSFPSFRSDLNSVLEAINTCNSGTSRPTSAVAGTIWLDTSGGATANLLKFYDGTDDITMGTINTTANTINFSDSALDVVTDLTPQLGGDLDVNGNDIVSTSNADINISPNGTGRVTLGASKIEQVAEKVTVDTGAGLSGTFNFDVITQAVRLHTGNNTANWTLNIRGDGSNSLNSIMDIGESITVALISTNGGTPYYNSAVQIDSSSVTPKWQGGSAPTEGNASSLDTYSYTIIKTADATFTVLASQTQFA